LRSADLREADLGGADLRGAFLEHADLEDANLTGADLRGADLEEAFAVRYHGGRLEWKDVPNLRATRYDRSTRWPAGFRPEENGARLVE
jgi:hypothetical protein